MASNAHSWERFLTFLEKNGAAHTRWVPEWDRGEANCCYVYNSREVSFRWDWGRQSALNRKLELSSLTKTSLSSVQPEACLVSRGLRATEVTCGGRQHFIRGTQTISASGKLRGCCVVTHQQTTSDYNWAGGSSEVSPGWRQAGSHPHTRL